MTTTSNHSNKPLIFVHIPKAAGTTINKIIERQYKLNAIYGDPGIRTNTIVERVENLPEERIKELKVIRGHVGFGFHELLPQPCTYFTLLRDPVDRLISNYFYVLGRPNHQYYQELKSQQMSLEDFAQSRRSYNRDNFQTRVLAGVKGRPDFTTVSTEHDRRKMLERAKRNLRDYFAVVGTVEEFDKSLLLLKKTFGWKNIFYFVKNKTKKRPQQREVSQTATQIIQDVSALDLELYEYGKEIMQELVECQGSSFAAELQKFRLTKEKPSGKTSALVSEAVRKFRRKLFTIRSSEMKLLCQK